MTHVYTKFGDIFLPLHDPVHDISTGTIESALIGGINGRAVNYLGTTRRLPGRQVISVEGVYHKDQTEIVDELGNNIVDEVGTLIITGEGPNLLRNQVLRLRAELGQLRKLWLKEIGTSDLRWKNCRLTNVEQIQGYAWGDITAAVSLSFETGQPKWKDETLTSNTTTLVAGSQTIIETSAGQDTVDDAIITISATGSSVTQVAIQWNGAHFSWLGTLLNGEDLVIDTGARTVLNDGDNDYSSFTLHSTLHTIDPWFRLQPSSNNISVTVNTACDIKFEYYDQWT